MYISKFFDAHGRERVVSDKISDSQKDRIVEAKTSIQQFLGETDHYLTVLMTAQGFLDLAQNGNYREKTKFIELNLPFNNYLNAFYSWKCFHNHDHGSCLAEPSKELRKAYQENNTTYCLASTLRNYTTHNGFAIDRIEYDVLHEEISFQIARDFYQYAEKEGSALLKKSIESFQSSGIEAVAFTKAFILMFKTLHQEIFCKAGAQIENEVKTLMEVSLVLEYK